MMKNTLTLIVAFAIASVEAIIPATVSIHGDGVGRADLSGSWTISERTPYSSSSARGPLYASGISGALSIFADGNNRLYVHGIGGGIERSIDLPDGQQHVDLPDSLFQDYWGGAYHQIYTNVVLTWGSTGLWCRVINATKYPVELKNNGSYNSIHPGHVGFTFPPAVIGSQDLTIDCTGLANSRVTITYIDHVDSWGGSDDITINAAGVHPFRANLGRIKIEEHKYGDIPEILYGDMGAGPHDRPIYGRSDSILYADLFKLANESNVVDGTNVMAFCEWQFSGLGDPDAYINGEMVCHGHSTTHIIEHRINISDPRASYDAATGIYTFEYNMAITSPTSPETQCNFVTWIGDSRAEFYGTTSSTPRFRATFNRHTKLWTVTHVN